MRYLVAFFLLWAGTAAAQPTCTTTAPGAISCLSPAVFPQLNDIVMGQQAAGPLRPNQTVQFSISQINSLLLGVSNTWSGAQTFGGGINASTVNLGTSGTTAGQLAVYNTASGSITVTPPMGALGSVALVWPAASGTLALVNTYASYQASPSNPTGTTDTTGKMMGLAGAITPSSSGKVLITITGTIANATAIADGAKVQIRYGTGSAPANAAALTGTAVGSLQQYIAATTAETAPFSVTAVVTGLTLSTAYWLDVGLAAITGGTAAITGVSITATELP